MFKLDVRWSNFFSSITVELYKTLDSNLHCWKKELPESQMQKLSFVSCRKTARRVFEGLSIVNTHLNTTVLPMVLRTRNEIGVPDLPFSFTVGGAGYTRFSLIPRLTKGKESLVNCLDIFPSVRNVVQVLVCNY